ELDDVAAVRLDREVLVEHADERALGLELDAILAGVGDRAAGGARRDAGALRRAQPPVHAVAVEQRGAPFGVERHGGVEVLARQIAVWPGAAGELVEAALVPS